jgi:hypothetical protein
MVHASIYINSIQYWPKVTHAKKRTSHVGCNACNARFRRVLHRICYYSNFAHMKRASCVQHLRGMCAGYALLTRLSRVCRPFMYCRCRVLLTRRKYTGPWVTFGQYCKCSFFGTTPFFREKNSLFFRNGQRFFFWTTKLGFFNTDVFGAW